MDIFNSIILFLLILWILTKLNIIKLIIEDFNQKSNQKEKKVLIKEKKKPTPEQVINYFNQSLKVDKGLDYLNSLIKKDFPYFTIPLRTFIYMIKLNIKKELTPDKLKSYL